MNCHEFIRILDERELHELQAGERADALAHLASCTDCARDHDLHGRMAALPIPPPGAQRIAQWRALASPQAMAERSRIVARGRFILIGTFAAVAAAAALLVTSLSGGKDIAVATAPRAQALPQVEASESPLGIAGPVTGPEARQQIELPAPPRPEATRSPRFISIHVQSLQLETQDPRKQAAVEEFYHLLVNELRALPEVGVVGPYPTVAPLESAADFILTGVAQEARGRMPLERTGLPAGDAGQWTAMLRLRVRTGESWRVQPILITGFLDEQDCRKSNPDAPAGSCQAKEVARGSFRLLRAMMFPADPALQAELREKFLDESQPLSERRVALHDLALVSKRRGEQLDAGLVREVLGLIGSTRDDATRLSYWRQIEGVASTEAIGPLVEATGQHNNLLLRMEATTYLAKYYSADATARAALEWLASNDANPRLRGIAQAALDAP